MLTPAFEGLPTLSEKFMSLVHSRNSGNRTALVIENLIGNMRRNPKACPPGHAGPSKIVKPPIGNAREFIQLPFGFAEHPKRFFPRKDVGTSVLALSQNSDR